MPFIIRGKSKTRKKTRLKETRERISGQSAGAPPSHSEPSSVPPARPSSLRSVSSLGVPAYEPTRPKRMRAAKAAPAFAMFLISHDARVSAEFCVLPYTIARSAVSFALRGPACTNAQLAKSHTDGRRFTGGICHAGKQQAAAVQRPSEVSQRPIFRHASDSQISARRAAC